MSMIRRLAVLAIALLALFGLAAWRTLPAASAASYNGAGPLEQGTLTTTPISASATAAIVNPDVSAYDKCENGDGAVATFYFADRFHSCDTESPGFVIVQKVKGVPVPVGRWTLKWIVTTTGSNKSSVMTSVVKSELWPAKTTGVAANPAWRLVVGIACRDVGNATCSATNAGGFDYDVATWDLPHTLTFTFNTSRSPGAGGTTYYNSKDALNYHTVSEWQNFPGHSHTYSSAAEFRCDRASYVNGAGCIFSQVMATWDISLSNAKVAAVAKHIWLAWKFPGTQTYPRKSHVVIPGFASTGVPLRRLYSKYDVKLYNANNATAVAACIAQWGKGYSQNNKYQCDEYPFRSTYEGASTANGKPYWYSVLVVPTSANSTAGGLLSAWLTANRILSGDQYWVAVVA